MEKRQFYVLYRQFLFRIVDLEVLSPQAKGDASKLLGQFAALLVFVSLSLSFPAIFSGGKADSAPAAASFVSTMIGQHFLIALTMLVVSVFAVLSWDSTFPDRGDALVLAPLPIRPRTLFLSKISAVATALAITVVLLHSVLGLIWPLVFTTRASPAILPALAFDPTPVPITVPDLKPMLDRALAQALTSGGLKPGTGAGLAIGVYKRGERQILTYGAARPDSLFEIGSITKTFTGLILARIAVDGQTSLDEPVRQLLPPGLVNQLPGEEITLADLATHHSGLPMMPRNFSPADPSNPYADYSVGKLYEYIKGHGLIKPEDTLYRYSNLGVGLLGQALADRAGKNYPDLLRDEITKPLGLSDTVITLSSNQQRRFLQGYDDHHKPVHEWNLDALAGAGGIRSTAGDLLNYLEANLHPQNSPALAAAVAITQAPRDYARGGAQIGLAWTYSPETGTYRHGGATGGFSSHAFFHPQCDCAAVVLMNSGPSLVFTPDSIAEHIRQRFAGEPAILLETVVVPAGTGLLRSFASYWFTMCAAGLFAYGLIQLIQGLLGLILPRGLFMRISGYVQTLAFCVAVCSFFLQPGIGGLDDLTARGTWRVFQWLPSYWFLGLYRQLSGSMHPALQPLAWRAWTGLAIIVAGVSVVSALSYARTLRKIVEEPDIPLASARWRWLPRFGNPFQTAVGQFTVRSLMRSKQHRLTLTFYIGVGLAFASLLLKDPSTKRALADSGADNRWRDASVALWASSVIMMALVVVGTRVVFAMPVDLRANWVFRLTGARSGRETLVAARRPLVLLAVIPVWIGSAAVCLGLWPSWQSAVHILTLGAMGLIVVELCIARFGKIPFAFSYLPGKSRIHLVFLGSMGLLLVSIRGVLLEREAFKTPGGAVAWLTVFIAIWIVVRIAVRQLAERNGETQFEGEEPSAIQGLGLDANYS